jgi:hypothetical protein
MIDEILGGVRPRLAGWTGRLAWPDLGKVRRRRRPAARHAAPAAAIGAADAYDAETIRVFTEAAAPVKMARLLRATADMARSGPAGTYRVRVDAALVLLAAVNETVYAGRDRAYALHMNAAAIASGWYYPAGVR